MPFPVTVYFFSQVALPTPISLEIWDITEPNNPVAMHVGEMTLISHSSYIYQFFFEEGRWGDDYCGYATDDHGDKHEVSFIKMHSQIATERIDSILTKTNLIPASPASETNATSNKNAIIAQTNLIKAKTANLPTDPASETNATANKTSIKDKTDLIPTLQSDLTLVKNKTDNLPPNPTSETNAVNYRDTILAAMPSVSNLALESSVQAVKTKTDTIPTNPCSEANATSNKNAVIAAMPNISLLALESTLTSVKTQTDLIPADPATNTQVNTRLPTSSYVAPDNANIALIKAKTDLIPRILGLNQENQYIDNRTYAEVIPDVHKLTGCRIRIYSDAISVGTDANVIATYTVSATYDVLGNMLTYGVVKSA